jgi:hypothetical protein
MPPLFDDYLKTIINVTMKIKKRPSGGEFKLFPMTDIQEEFH